MKGCETMAYTEAQKKATLKYKKNHYERLAIDVPTGTRERYKEIAQSKGLSLNQYVIGLIEADIKKGE